MCQCGPEAPGNALGIHLCPAMGATSRPRVPTCGPGSILVAGSHCLQNPAFVLYAVVATPGLWWDPEFKATTEDTPRGPLPRDTPTSNLAYPKPNTLKSSNLCPRGSLCLGPQWNPRSSLSLLHVPRAVSPGSLSVHSVDTASFETRHF